MLGRVMALPLDDSMDLFDQPDETVLADFTVAFDTWAKAAADHRRWRQDSTEEAYRQIWAPFVRWCVAQSPPIAVRSVDDRDLEVYLQTHPARPGRAHDLSERYVARFLAVVDCVLITQTTGVDPGPGSVARSAVVRRVLERHPAWRWAQASVNDALPDHLDAESARLLVTYLARFRDRPTAAGEGSAGSSLPSGTWQSMRDAAAVALHLGAGVTPIEARQLKVKALIAVPGSNRGNPSVVRIPAHTNVPERDAPLAGWAAGVLARWLKVRVEQGIAGELLFSSTRTGKPWSKDSHLQAVQRVLEDAGLEPHLTTGGAYRLRHTFALRQLGRNTPPDQVARWLGVQDAKVMARYSRVNVGPPVEVV